MKPGIAALSLCFSFVGYVTIYLFGGWVPLAVLFATHAVAYFLNQVAARLPR